MLRRSHATSPTASTRKPPCARANRSCADPRPWGTSAGHYLDARTGQWICSAALNDVFGIGDDYVKDVAGWIALVHPDEKDEMLRYLREHVLAGRNRFEREYRIVRHRDGQARWVHGLGELEFDEAGNPTKMIGTIQDITVRRQAEDALRASLEEKVVLLKEVHHRVKNNLQIISSLLNLQSAKTRNSEVQDRCATPRAHPRHGGAPRDALRLGQPGPGERQRATSRPSARRSSARSCRTAATSGSCEDVADVMLPLDQAIPVGLILNELLSNAFKHAFVDRVDGRDHRAAPTRRRGSLRAAASPTTASASRPSAERCRPGSIGLLLVESLVRQLEGELARRAERPGRRSGSSSPSSLPNRVHLWTSRASSSSKMNPSWRSTCGAGSRRWATRSAGTVARGEEALAHIEADVARISC